MGPSVSVIIPAFNSARFLRHAVLSVLADVPKAEVIVVDDGSSDGCLRTVEDLPIVRLALASNHGPAYARNQALALARGEYLAFLDSDDRLAPQGLSWRVDWLLQHPGAAGVVGNLDKTMDADGNAFEVFPDLAAMYQRLPDQITWAGMHTHRIFPSPLNATLFRASVFRDIGRFDEKLLRAEDRDFLYRLLKQVSLAHVSRPVFQYRIHDQNISVRAQGNRLHAFTQSESYRILVDMEHGIPLKT